MAATKSVLSRIGEGMRFISSLLLLPIALLLAVITLYGRLLFRPLIYCLVWALWLPRGVCVLFVYPDHSPYAERFGAKILPVLRGCAEVLPFPNFGPREWRRTVAVAVYRQFSGCFVPMALVFRPFRRAKRFAFYPIWRDYCNGAPGASEALHTMEQLFFEYVQQSKSQLNAGRNPRTPRER